jgi:radical SAM superfamily enzyme YgiQ (UPF0313 family)
MDLARFDDEYLEDMARHHVGGQLKVAPEHTSEKVLGLMKKPATSTFDDFARKFAAASERAGKEQYLIPYFIASHPGSGVLEMIELAVFLKQRGYARGRCRTSSRRRWTSRRACTGPGSTR